MFARALVAFAALLAALPALAQPTHTRWALSDAIDAVLDDDDFVPGWWGVHVADLESGEVLYSRASYGWFIPASNMKLVTTAAALDVLGPDYRFETRLYADGAIAYGTLSGPLVVRGSGDPAFAGRRRAELRDVFHGWADSLRARRVRTVLGPILVADDADEVANASFARAFTEVLHDEGIEVVDPTVVALRSSEIPDYGHLTRVATYRSAPLAAYVRHTNEESDNAYAERLLRATAARVYGGPSSPDGWSEAVGSSLRRLGVDPRSVVMADGSGLSRANRMTPAGAVELLSVMWHHPVPAVREAFVSSLPVGGYTGTLRRRYRTGDARGNVRAKTGFINNVRTLSGYVTTSSGRPLVFSLMCNGYTVSTSRVNRAQDAVVELLADFAARREVGG